MRPAITLASETRQTYRIFRKGSLAAQACRAAPSACDHRLSQRPSSQRRSYGAPAKKYKVPAKNYTAPATTPRPRVPNNPPLNTAKPKTFPARTTHEFSSADIPPMTVWESLLGLAPKDLTLADLDGTARNYCSAAIKNTSTWKGTLEKGRHMSSPPRYHPRELIWKLNVHAPNQTTALTSTHCITRRPFFSRDQLGHSGIWVLTCSGPPRISTTTHQRCPSSVLCSGPPLPGLRVSSTRPPCTAP